jgi:rhodanese-related sulfurtransferase
MGQVFLEEEAGKLSKKETIVIICKSGVRAGVVARELREMGYDAAALEGGMDEWKA